MQKNANSIPLMYIQTISNMQNDNPNQVYYDSRFPVNIVKNKHENTSLTESLVIIEEVKKQLILIENALKKKMKVTCEIVLRDDKILLGSISDICEESFILDGKEEVLLVNVLEITIQTLSYV